MRQPTAVEVTQPEVRPMDQNRSDQPVGVPAGAQNADAGAPSGGAGPERRNSARRKLAAVTRLLRGEPLEALARELNVTVARLSEWRDRALVAAEAAMKERERDGRDEELLRLKAKLGEVTMANELLEQSCSSTSAPRSSAHVCMARATARSGPGCAMAASAPRPGGSGASWASTACWRHTASAVPSSAPMTAPSPPPPWT